MASVSRYLLIILVLLLVVSNVFWASAYYVGMQCRDSALKEGSTALAIILAHAGTLLRESGEKGQANHLEMAYMLIDHALLVAQTLNKLSGNSDWTETVVGAVASLHDLLASTHQGHRLSKDKLVEIGDTLEKLAAALRNLNTVSVKQYSQKLESLTYTT